MKGRKRRILSVLFIITMLLSGCGEQTAVKNDEQKTYVLTEELLVSLQNTKFTEPKNIIYMIGDGMGENIIHATQEKYGSQLYGNQLAMNYLTKVGTHSSYSASDKITDSAAGGTALASGKKTSNYTVGMNYDHTENYQSVLEMAAEKGKSTGIIATKAVTDATPAAFTAHVEDRKMQNAIAKQQLQKIADGSLDLVLGGGSEYYEYFDNETVFEEAVKKGMSYSKIWEETLQKQLPLVGLFASDALNTTAPNIPSLAEMTELALMLLSEDENGFFLMVEGSQIDTRAHDNTLDKQMQEVYQFDCAVTVAMEFITKHPDTILIVTADHETGGLYFPKEGYGEGDSYIYLSDDHTSINVPVYAIGYGTYELGGTIENTDIAEFVAALLGETDVAQKSVVTKLYDGTEAGNIEIAFDENRSTEELLTSELSAKLNNVQNARAMHMVIRNVGEDKVSLPALKIQTADGITHNVVSQYAYIDTGETLDLTYILPVELWQNNVLSNANSIQITSETVAENAWKTTFGYEGETLSLEIAEISITDRGLEN